MPGRNPARTGRDYSDRQEPLGYKIKAKQVTKVPKKRLAKQERIDLSAPPPAPEPTPASSVSSINSTKTLLLLLSQISAPTLSSSKLTPTLQAIKGALFERDYARAFGSPEYLRAYVARWVPSRALAYREMFGGSGEGYEEGEDRDDERRERGMEGVVVEEIRKLLGECKDGEVRRKVTKIREEVVEVPKEEGEGEDGEGAAEGSDEEDGEAAAAEPESESEDDEPASSRTITIICIGGGAGSEVLALASTVRSLGTPAKVHVQAVDSADWGAVLGEMMDVVVDKWRLPKTRFDVEFVKRDVLVGLPGGKKERGVGREEREREEEEARKAIESVSLEERSEAASTISARPTPNPSTSAQPATVASRQPTIKYSSADLITLLFTTAELLTASRPQTLSFLSHLTTSCAKGTLLLIVESAGSFSAMSVGATQFPLEFLLDLVLAGGKDGKNGGWEIVEKEESRWWRLPEGVSKGYPLRLENMRHMLRLYRKR